MKWWPGSEKLELMTVEPEKVRPGDFAFEYRESDQAPRGARWCLVIASCVMSNIRGTMTPRHRLLLLNPELGLFTRSYSWVGEKVQIRR